MTKNMVPFRIAVSLLFLLLVSVGIYMHRHSVSARIPSTITPASEVTSIIDSAGDWIPSFGGSSVPEKLPFAKIASVAFGMDQEHIDVRFNLAGKIPKHRFSPSTIYKDTVTGLFYYLTIDDNYFDSTGRKNPSGIEAYLKVGIFGDDHEVDDVRKITVTGTMIAGGAGHDYFIVRYPKQELLSGRNPMMLVITARSLVLSKEYPAGLTQYEMRNYDIAATLDNPAEMKVYLTPPASI